MNTQRNYLRASLLAPLVVAAPLVALSGLAWIFMNPITDGDAPFHLAGVGIVVAPPIYIAGVIGCYCITTPLSKFGRLSPVTLILSALVLSALVSVLAVGAWLQVPGGLGHAFGQLIFFFIAALVWLCPTLLAWWWLASSMSGSTLHAPRAPTAEQR
jgi:hypothetical protein